MMDWESRLKELSGYNISFEIKQGYYHVALIYDNGWNVLAPDNEFLYVEERNGVYHYIGSIDDIKIEDIFKAIDATIEYNMDLQKKLLLFKQKTDELQQLFANEDYEKLQTLNFVFIEEKANKKSTKKSNNKQTTNKKVKTKRTKKTEQPITEKLEEVTEQNTDKTCLNSISTADYDDNEEIVTMTDTYIEELEK